MPASQPARSRELEAAFLSPAWTFPLPEGPGGVTDPGLPLRLHDAFRRTRSALTSLPGCLENLRGDLRPRPVVRRSDANPESLNLPAAPLRGFRPSRSTRAARLALSAACRPERPIARRSPTATLFSPPDHRSGLATFLSARCSVNLLEPSLLCNKARKVSTEIVTERPFPAQLYSPCFQ